jgi:hypothetical protein
MTCDLWFLRRSYLAGRSRCSFFLPAALAFACSFLLLCLVTRRSRRNGGANVRLRSGLHLRRRRQRRRLVVDRRGHRAAPPLPLGSGGVGEDRLAGRVGRVEVAQPVARTQRRHPRPPPRHRAPPDRGPVRRDNRAAHQRSLPRPRVTGVSCRRRRRGPGRDGVRRGGDLPGGADPGPVPLHRLQEPPQRARATGRRRRLLPPHRPSSWPEPRSGSTPP